MNTGIRILVVDDEPQIQRFLKLGLTAGGFAVTAAMTGGEAIRMIAATAPDLVLLDLGLPDLDGKDVIRQARAFSAVPIIVVSARDREAEKIEAFDLGADDYVNKPFGIGELLARIRTALRHRLARQAELERITAGEVEIDLAHRRVRRAGEEVHLSPKEYDVLAALAKRPDRVISHTQLLREVWGPAHEHRVDYLRIVVRSLRQKLEADPAWPGLIRNEPGVGYRLVAGHR